MKTYTILVIDDDFKKRKEVYCGFFEDECGDEGDYKFKIHPIQTVSEFTEFCDKWERVDAIFLDAILDGSWTNQFSSVGVLEHIEKKYVNRHTPPVFMVSSQWNDNHDLLMNVSLNISRLEKFDHPSAYYNFEVVQSIVEDVKSYKRDPDKDSASSLLVSLKNQRRFIRTEIEKKRAIEKADAIIFLSVPDEKISAYDVFGLDDSNDEVIQSNGLVYQTKSIDEFRIAFVTLSRMGLSEAARETESAILLFEPSVVIMAGICAGDKERTKLGTIVVPKQIYDYSSGKIFTDKDNEPKFQQRIEGISYSPSLAAFFQYIENSNNGTETIFAIQKEYMNRGSIPEKDVVKNVVTGLMASGPWVVDSAKVFDFIKSFKPNDRLNAIDMEAYAFASVANTHGVPWLVVKTVQDYANGSKTDDEETSRRYAAFSSACFVKNYIKKIVESARFERK